MLTVMFVAAFASGALGASELEPEDCGDHLLDKCVDNLPGPKQFGLPRNIIMLDRHCNQYHVGMGCMDAWMERCTPGDRQREMRARTAGVRALMALMCNSTMFRKEYLKEEACWSAVSADLSGCIDALHERAASAAADVSVDSHAEICCEREEFERCVVRTTRSRCSAAAADMLRRMARLVMPGEAAACAPRPRARCSAPAPPGPAATAVAVSAAACALLAATRSNG